MVQTVQTILLYAGQQKIFFEKPRVLSRILFGITVMVGTDVWRRSRLSFGDRLFSSYYNLDGPYNHFEVKGDGISQEDIWLRNSSGIALNYSAIEILV